MSLELLVVLGPPPHQTPAATTAHTAPAGSDARGAVGALAHSALATNRNPCSC
jgi:hypothetical protein